MNEELDEKNKVQIEIQNSSSEYYICIYIYRETVFDTITGKMNHRGKDTVSSR